MIFLALGLSLTVGFASWAEPYGMRGHQRTPGHWGYHGKFANLTPEQVGKLFDLRQKFMDDTAGLRKDMLVKRAELRTLWQADNPDEKQIVAKLKEINAVRDKLQPKTIALRLEVKKILPKGPASKGKVSMGEEDMNMNPILAMEPGDQNDL